MGGHPPPPTRCSSLLARVAQLLAQLPLARVAQLPLATRCSSILARVAQVPQLRPVDVLVRLLDVLVWHVRVSPSPA